MQHSWARRALAGLVGIAVMSCGESPATSPTTLLAPGARGNAGFTGPKVVISQVYGGGGNSNALYQNDFVELFNAGSAAATLDNWSVQYASATGTGNFGANSNQLVTISGTLQPGQYYLVKMASGGTAGAVLPSADATNTGINMAAGAGKVALVNQPGSLGCNGGSNPCDAVAMQRIVDLVGYGTGSSGANFSEGGSPAPTISATLADVRVNHGCTDEDKNSTDFATGSPAPRNTATTKAPCGGGSAIGPLDHVVVTGPSSINRNASVTLSAELQDASNKTITDPAATYVWTSSDPTVAGVQSTSGNTATIQGVKAGGPVTISVTATSNGASGPGSEAVTVFDAIIVPSTTVVSEIHYDNTGNDVDEKIEIEGDKDASLNGWNLVLYDGNGGVPYATVPLSGTIPATCGTRGVVTLTFAPNGIQNGPDGWALVNADGKVTEFRSYEGTFAATSGPAAGLTSTAIEADETTAPAAGQSVQRAGNGVWFGPAPQTFGTCNPAAPVDHGTLSVNSGKLQLALGMQTQFFFDGVDRNNAPVTSVTWTTSDASVITVDANGVVTAKAIGSAQLRATAIDGSFGTADMTVYLAAGSTGIRLGHNTEFGEPTDATPLDDFLIRRDQYTVSYNPNRGGANWVSWNLDASHIGNNGRCSGTCYSADTVLSRKGLPAYTTADWVSNATYDRGHMAPSADWTSSEADNNTTFFLSNFLPQAPDLNQGPWEMLESALRDSVSVAHGSREAYIIAGGIFTNGVGLGTLRNLGKIAIPDSTWKIAVITPAGTGLNPDGTLPANTTVLAVNMPNKSGIKGADWHDYITTIGKIQNSTGYDFLSMLTEAVQCKVEVRNCKPVPAIVPASGSATAKVGTAFVVNTSATDADGADGPWRYVLEWGDGTNFTATLSALPSSTRPTARGKVYTAPGTYTIRLTITDRTGNSGVQTLVVTVAP